MATLDLLLLPGEYVIGRLPPNSPLPAGLTGRSKDVISVTWAPDEMSILCPKDRAPEGVTTDTLWRCFRAGAVSLTQTGVLAALVAPLASSHVNIFAFSTHDTDYLLVPAVRLDEATAALGAAGYRISQA